MLEYKVKKLVNNRKKHSGKHENEQTLYDVFFCGIQHFIFELDQVKRNKPG
jgi:hypothetical protein